MTKGLVYVADDEKDIRELIKSFLEEAGHTVKIFENGDLLFEEFKIQEPDLIILDVMMPGTDGFAMTNKIREISEVPILLLTAKDTDMDYIAGFTAGCDDYFTKPFSLIKLMMRVNAILKRENKLKKDTDDLVFGDIILSQQLKKCEINGVELNLTKTEHSLLTYLIDKKDSAVSREELLNDIWGYSASVETRVTDDTIKRLRKKLKDSGSEVQIETVWGFGFRLKLAE
ncbi:DNA-binding response regulator, OmpR family, contains REC and winged-helix (wHTH) domain [Peptoniphilus asaccharolyticus DSM 20463]|uniref:DNA-binding response regulator, OmpR family, contains REC and winged-helix (WHTH) domain n=1 Tax=Peptoniphilus asaccharolyticus DSM 20463 TaxID=573058 RepID=A0A1W1UGL8_PEPAS|nr:response regulator transcription factor [Peptoniphilus asaccharolyticus]MBL7574692.1 response regulator transcription factor [Peptoniphilus asaccharolyticus]SMB80210.1 DNA-binding response regulator, OmpR family, contains REC and winged-helix (wHTH) domain [Peptoniphilus asaccharolyticus DSM 20463]